MIMEAEMWKAKYQVLLTAVTSTCGMAEFMGRRMTGRECIDLITAAVKAIEDGGTTDVELEPEVANVS